MKRRRLMVVAGVLWAGTGLAHAFLRVQRRIPLDTWDSRPLLERVQSTWLMQAPFYAALLFVALGLAYAYGTRLDGPRASMGWPERSFSEALSVAGWLVLATPFCGFAFVLVPPLWALTLLGFYGTPWLASAWLLWALVEMRRSAGKGVVPTRTELRQHTVLSLLVAGAVFISMPP